MKQLYDFFLKRIPFIASFAMISTACGDKEEPAINCVAYDKHPDFLSCQPANWSGDEASNLSRLRVAGNKIVDDACNEVILKGVAVPDPYFLVSYMKKGESFIKELKDFGVNVIRFPIHPEMYETPMYFEKYLDKYVEYCNKHGIYAFVGYHAHGNINTGKSELPDWRFNPPWRGNPFNSDKSLAKKMLKNAIERYKNKPWVIYGTFNEPTYIQWKSWVAPCEELIDVIHGVDERALVTVSGVDWGYDLSDAISNPIKRKNVIYETHAYPWKGEKWKSVFCELGKKYPVFVGEWGFGKKLSPQATTSNYAIPLLEYCKRNKIGWTTWIYDDKHVPPMLNQNGSLTEFGQIVKQYLSKPKST